jgi:hypothetical protein
MREWINMVETDAGAYLPATPANITLAKAFVFEKWKERAAEMGRSTPEDLSYACKFTSIFAQRVFGGELRGNYDHQYLVTHDGKIVDLNEEARDVLELGDDAHEHDDEFFGSDDHEASLASCLPRVEKWVQEFLAS